MTEAWFDPNLYAWIPGTVFGVTGGLMGAVVGCMAPPGRARAAVLRLWFSVLGLAVLLAAAGLVALMKGQPYGVWFGLLMPGADGTIVIGALSPLVLKRYREAEERKMAARDLVGN